MNELNTYTTTLRGLLEVKNYAVVSDLIMSHFPEENVNTTLDIAKSINNSLEITYKLLQEYDVYNVQYLFTSPKPIFKKIDLQLAMQAKSIKKYLWEVKSESTEFYNGWMPINIEDYFQTFPIKIFGEFYIFPKNLEVESIITRLSDTNRCAIIEELVICNKRNIAHFESLTKYSIPVVKEWFFYLKEDIEGVNRMLLSRKEKNPETIANGETKNNVKVPIPATQYALIIFLLIEKFGVNIIKTGEKKEFIRYFIQKFIKEIDVSLPFDLEDIKRFEVENKINQLTNTYKPEKPIKKSTLDRYLKSDMLFNLKKKEADGSKSFNSTLLEEVNTIWKNKLGYDEKITELVILDKVD